MSNNLYGHSRFDLGDQVRILSNPATPFSGLQGLIDEFVPHPRNLSQLDCYFVKFNWGERQKFFRVQLQLVKKSQAA